MNITILLLIIFYLKRWVKQIIKINHPELNVGEIQVKQIDDDGIKVNVHVIKTIDKIDIKFAISEDGEAIIK